jgi:hypothetical protein
MENHHFQLVNPLVTISMVIFNSYVKLPEGKHCKSGDFPNGTGWDWLGLVEGGDSASKIEV